MVRIQYKQRCSRCKKNYILTTRTIRFPVCYECEKEELQGDIKDIKMKKMFAIPEKYYKENQFLRSIKINYLKWGKLSEKQIGAFKKAVKDIRSK